MIPLNLTQTLEYLRVHLPPPFDLPQLAHLCRTGQLTPLFAYDRYVLGDTEYSHQSETFFFNGYLTAPQIPSIIESNGYLELTRAIIYYYTNAKDTEARQAMQGEKVFLLANGFNYYQYQTNDNYSVFSDKDTFTIVRKDLRFDREQVESIAGNDETAKLHARIAELENELATLRGTKPSDTPANDEALFAKLDPRTQNNFIRLLLAINEQANQKRGGIDLTREYNENQRQAINAQLGRLGYKELGEHAYKTLISLVKSSQQHGL